MRLADSGIGVELTGTTRAGLIRFRYPKPGHAVVTIEANTKPSCGGEIEIDEARQEVRGYNVVHRLYAGQGKRAGFSGYFVVRFSRPFRLGGTWSGAERHDGATKQQAGQDTPGAYVTVETDNSGVLEAKVGTSFTSVDEARKNLNAELPGWDFEGTVRQVRAAWSELMNKIQVNGNAPERAVFYTALYHSLLLPRVASDVDGSYPEFGGSGKIVKEGFTYYDDYSIWDTFRAVHPLILLLDPKRETDMIKSLLEKGREGGFLPIYPAWGSYTSEMIGDHADAIIVDAYAKGLRDFDADLAYKEMRKNAMELPADPALYEDGRGGERSSLT